ncbi:MAG: sigma-70 family RNA polymerase sigma factor, partial [FCB group bacterium]|nr:sigma-70 family RNA polymerase sigma factor [FCB group bacterium]
MRDDQLVAQILAGDTAQFEALVDRYLPMVRGLCRSRVANASSHDDLVQEVFLQGYLQLDRLRDRARFGPWLARIASNQCYSWLRGQSRRMQLDTHLASEAPRVAPPADVEAMQRETVEWVRQAIARLPEKIRDAMTLFYVEGLTVSEAARCLDIRESALRKRLQYGRKSVGEELFAHLEPQTLPESEEREQKARVLAALPLATVPWKAGAAAGSTSTGLAVLTKLALVTLPVAVVAVTVVAAGTSWRPAWPASAAAGSASKAVAEREAFSGSEVSPVSPKGSQPVKVATTGDLALKVTFRVPSEAGRKVVPPVAANTRLWLVPVRINRAKLGPLLRQAGLDTNTADAVLNAMDEPRIENGSGASILSNAVGTREAFEAVQAKLAAIMRDRDMKQEDFFAPAYDTAREVFTDAQGKCEARGLAAGRYLIGMEKPTPEKTLDFSACDGGFVQSGKRTEQNVSIDDATSAVRGVVVDATTGEPVNDVEVALSGIPMLTPGMTCQSKDEGRFKYAPRATGYGPFTLRVTSNAYTPVTVRGERRPGVPTFVEVRLNAQRAVVTGRVTSADGTPAPGVSIMREMVAGEGGAQSGATTDADGGYVMPHDGGRFTLYASGTNLKSESATLDLVMDEMATQDFVFPPCGRVVIELRTPAFERVPDEIRNLLLIADHSASVLTLKKGNGVFTLDHVKPDSYTLVVDANGQPAADADFNVVFTKAYYASDGRFTGRTGCIYLAETADANGVCLLEGLPPGEYSLEKGEAIVNFVAPTNEEVLLCIAPSSAETKRAYLTLAKSNILPVDENGAELPLQNKAMEVFIVSASGMVSDSRIELGSNTLYAIKGGYTASVTNIDLSPPLFAERKNGGDFNSPVKAVFGQGGAITGYLTDEAGEPVADRRLNVLPAELLDVAAADWSKNESSWNNFMRALAQGAKTQADGSFRLEFLPEGQYYVTAGALEGVFPFEGNPVEVRRGADTGPITLTESADDKIGRPRRQGRA